METFVVMGANGHVGSAVANCLLERGESVVVVVHHGHGADAWKAKGAGIAEADVEDAVSLRRAFQRGRRAFLLNPPADIKTDTDAVERRSAKNILAGLEESRLDKVVAASTAGAQPGERLGDLSVLWEFEEGLRRQAIPAAINRAAYYMSNWDAMLNVVRARGSLPSMLPADFKLPMVAPADLGKVAANRLVSSCDDVGVRHVEGPARYSPSDVARAFAVSLQRTVDISETPRAEWKEAFMKLGFSERAAESFARMTALSVDQGFDLGKETIHGAITLESYIQNLVERSDGVP